MSNTRRNFIKTVILGTGAVFVDWSDVFAATFGKSLPVTTNHQHFGTAHEYLSGTKRLPSQTRTEKTDYVIVGGGTAGIAAAWRLKKMGKEFLLLENEEHLGGVMLNPSPAWNGIPCPLGSTYFVRNNGIYGDFLADMNVRPIETGEDAFCFDEKNIVVDPWNPSNLSQLPLPTADRDAFREFRDFVLAIPLPTYPLNKAPKDVIAEYDSLTASEFVGRFNSMLLTQFMDLYSRSVLGAPLNEVNAYSFLSFYSVEFGDAFNLPCWTLPGGLGSIAAGAERFIRTDHVKTNAAVVRVENTNGGVTVTSVDRLTGEVVEIRAKAAIIAAPKKIARKMVVGLPDDQSKAMGELKYAPYITVALCCNAPLFKTRAFDFWINDTHGRFTDIIDATSSMDAQAKFHRTGANAYMVSAPRPAGSFATMDEPAMDKYLAALAQEIAEAVVENVPDARGKIEELHVFGWTNSMVVPTVGSYQRLAPIIARSHGNIHFAHSDNDIAPGWESAVWHGDQLARTIS